MRPESGRQGREETFFVGQLSGASSVRIEATAIEQDAASVGGLGAGQGAELRLGQSCIHPEVP